MTVCASVVVPTRDRYQMLERCLVALSEQTCERHLYEILVVDDANSECTRAAAFDTWPRVWHEGRPQHETADGGPLKAT